MNVYQHTYYVMLQVGHLVRWIVSHASYEASGDVLVGREPIYKYGIVLKVSPKSPSHFIVATYDDARWYVLDTEYDHYEILSDGVNNG
jgi:hypothetical protein